MAICPITYEPLHEGERYSSRGLSLLSPGLVSLADFPYTAEEQAREAAARAARMSIQGVQPKLSARLVPSRGTFEVTDRGGTYIIKPQNMLYPHLPENEDLTMGMAAIFGIEVPIHGLIYSKGGSFSYFIRRFDRPSRGTKLSIEDFAQLGGFSRDTKYDSSMEQVAGIIEKFCTFPVVEKLRLFERTLFNFVTGNEDMHLKNFSVIRRQGRVELAPAYDFLNTCLVLRNPDEMALPLRGKKSRITFHDIVEYYGMERLGLNRRVIDSTLARLRDARDPWLKRIRVCFLPADMKERYIEILDERLERIGL